MLAAAKKELVGPTLPKFWEHSVLLLPTLAEHKVAAGPKWLYPPNIQPETNFTPVRWDACCRNYKNSSNDNNNRFQDNLGCSAFTVCNLNSPFAHDIKRKKKSLLNFFYFLRQRWISRSRMHLGETLTHQKTFRNDCRLFGGALLWMKFRCDK